MKSAIEKVFYGETNFQNVPVTEEWKRLADKSSKIYEEFYASLTEKQKQQFEEIYHYDGGQCAEMELQYYKEGFKLGLMLAVEAVINQ